MSIIKDLKIENEDYTLINFSTKDWFNNLSKVNIFIGANNSGKSRFMRSIFYQDKDYELKFLPNDVMFDKFLKQSEEFKNSLQKRPNIIESTDQQRAKRDILQCLHEIEYIEESKRPYQDLINIYIETSETEIKQPMSYAYECNEIFKKFFEGIEFDYDLFRYNFYRIYIPSLRGLIPPIPAEYKNKDELKGDLYAKRIKNDYFQNEDNIITDVNEFLENADENKNSQTEPLPIEKLLGKYQFFPKHSIIAGLQFYEYVRNYLLGDLEQRQMIREYEKYLSETFFDNEKVVIIPKVNNDVLTVRIGEEEYKIYELGEGIQSIILITLPLFLYLDLSRQNNTNILVFIEEPEIGLHPRLQRTLIETMIDKRFENYQFFFTTHSNHFIDQTLIDEDISVCLFNKEFDEENSKPDFNIYKINNEYWEVMEKLGAMPSSVLMSNCTILVEGTTDRDHFELYLNLYQKQLPKNKPRFKSGIHYSFLIAGGDEYKNTISSLNEIQKEKMYFICDYDNKQKNEKRKEFLEKHSFDNYHVLSVTEVENLVSKDIVIKTLENTYETDELKMNKNFSQEEYSKSENFYEFIVDKILNHNLPEKFARGKGNLKTPLCRNENRYVQNYDELTDESKEIARIIYNFIKQNN